MYKDILIAVDLDPDDPGLRLTETAVELAKAMGATLHVMTVVPDFGMSIVGGYFPDGYEEEAIEESRKRLHAFTAEKVPAGVPVQHIVGHGGIYREILRAAAEIGADLIVVGSHKPELSDYLIGPNAAQVMRHATCSVLVVRAKRG